MHMKISLNTCLHTKHPKAYEDFFFIYTIENPNLTLQTTSIHNLLSN